MTCWLHDSPPAGWRIWCPVQRKRSPWERGCPRSAQYSALSRSDLKMPVVTHITSHNSLRFILILITSKLDFKSTAKKINSCSHHSRVEAPKAQGVHQSFGAGALSATLGSCKKALSVRQVLLGGPRVALLEGHTVIICKPVHIHKKKKSGKTNRWM